MQLGCLFVFLLMKFCISSFVIEEKKTQKLLRCLNEEMAQISGTQFCLTINSEDLSKHVTSAVTDHSDASRTARSHCLLLQRHLNHFPLPISNDRNQLVTVTHFFVGAVKQRDKSDRERREKKRERKKKKKEKENEKEQAKIGSYCGQIKGPEGIRVWPIA